MDKVTLKKGRAIVSFRQEKRKVDAALDCYIICTFTRWYNKKYQRHNCMSKVGFVRNSIYGKGLKKMARAWRNAVERRMSESCVREKLMHGLMRGMKISPAYSTLQLRISWAIFCWNLCLYIKFCEYKYFFSLFNKKIIILYYIEKNKHI